MEVLGAGLEQGCRWAGRRGPRGRQGKMRSRSLAGVCLGVKARCLCREKKKNATRKK